MTMMTISFTMTTITTKSDLVDVESLKTNLAKHKRVDRTRGSMFLPALDDEQAGGYQIQCPRHSWRVFLYLASDLV
jgi:hypothetical protein